MTKYIKVPQAELKQESPTFEDANKEEFKKFSMEFEEPRMFTMTQIRDMIFLHLNRSSLKQLVYMNSEHIQKHRIQLNHSEKSE